MSTLEARKRAATASLIPPGNKVLSRPPQPGVSPTTLTSVNSESVPSHPISNAAKSAELVYRAYAAMADTFAFDADLGLGGKLLYAGELGSPSRDLLLAANIAGAASLAASADPAAQRLAIREGVVDFSVTSLEEALRILKNEIRKRQPVSVAVGADPLHLVEQMLDRGVLPDLLPLSVHDSPFIVQGARLIPDSAVDMAEFVTWSVDREFGRWMPQHMGEIADPLSVL